MARRKPSAFAARAHPINLLMCLSLRCMNRLMADRAAQLIRPHLLHDRRVSRTLVEILRGAVTAQAVAIGKRFVKLDGTLAHPDSSVVSDHVPHSVQLGHYWAHELVVYVTSVTLVRDDPSVSIMLRCQRRAVGILQVGYPGRHRVTRRAEAQPFGAVERQRKDCQCEQRGRDTQD